MRPRTQATTFQASWPWVYDVAKPDHIVELCGRDFHYSPYVLLTSVGLFHVATRSSRTPQFVTKHGQIRNKVLPAAASTVSGTAVVAERAAAVEPAPTAAETHQA